MSDSGRVRTRAQFASCIKPYRNAVDGPTSICPRAEPIEARAGRQIDQPLFPRISLSGAPGDALEPLRCTAVFLKY
jgi:hypothetical protein